MENENLERVPIEWLDRPTIECQSSVSNIEMDGQGDMRIPLFEYLKVGKLPDDKNKARKLKWANRFVMIDGALYKKGCNQSFLKCLNEGEAEYVLS